MGSQLVASPGVSPDVASAFEQGGREAIAGYNAKLAADQAVIDAAQAKKDQLEAEDRATKRQYALLAYQAQQRAAETKAQNAVEFNQSRWTNVTGTYLSNLAEKQANAETWLDPKNVANITPESAEQARNLIKQVQDIYQHVADNTPSDFSTYHEPAAVINAKPLTAQFAPAFTDAYKAELEAKKQKELDQVQHVQLENQKLAWEVAHPKQAHSGGGGDRTLAREIAFDRYKSARNFYQGTPSEDSFETVKDTFRSNYGKLKTIASQNNGYIPKSAIKKDEKGKSIIDKTNESAANLSRFISNWGNVDPSYSGITGIWNEGKAKYNGLQTTHDIEQYIGEKTKQVSSLPPNDPERRVVEKLYGIIFGGGSY